MHTRSHSSVSTTEITHALITWYDILYSILSVIAWLQQLKEGWGCRRWRWRRRAGWRWVWHQRHDSVGAAASDCHFDSWRRHAVKLRISTRVNRRMDTLSFNEFITPHVTAQCDYVTWLWLALTVNPPIYSDAATCTSSLSDTIGFQFRQQCLAVEFKALAYVGGWVCLPPRQQGTSNGTTWRSGTEIVIWNKLNSCKLSLNLC